MTKPAPHALRTPVWLLRGFTGFDAGVLELAEGRLAFTTAHGRVFAVWLSEVTDVKFPWYYFGGGVHLTIDTQQYRMSFVRPTGAGGTLLDLGPGLKAGRAWRAALAERIPH